MLLSMVEEKRLVKIVKIMGGKNFVSKIMNMGIKEGEVIKVLNNAQGPVLISMGNTRIGLGRGASFKIFVEYIKEEKKRVIKLL